MMPLVYIGVGSNLGDRFFFIRESERRLGLLNGIHRLISAPVYESEALLLPGQDPQPLYLNTVFECQTTLVPDELLSRLQMLEKEMGRQIKESWTARTLDLDLLLYDDCVLSREGLMLPHPGIETRAFVLQPLCDLNPQLRHPVLHRSFRELLDLLDLGGLRRYDS